MTASTIGRGATPDAERRRDMTPGGIAASAALHVTIAALVVFGVPNLFRKPPPRDMPIAVQLVTIAPETRATHPNPARPRPDAKPEPPVAEPAPIPEPKPEPPAPQPPPSAAAPAPAPPPPAPPLPKPEAKAPPPPPPPKPEAKAPPPPPPPKTVEARTPIPMPPPPEPKPRPKPEPHRVARAEAKPEPRPQHAAAADSRHDPRSKPEPQHLARAEPKKLDPAAFGKLLNDLETHDKKDDPEAFDNLLKNLTRQQTAHAADMPPAPRKLAALTPPSSQPRAPLGSELTASEIDRVREQIARCWNIPAGARDAKDLVIKLRGTIAPDGRVLQAAIVDQGRMSDPFFRAAAESAKRALFHPLCTPLRLPPEKYESWKTFEIDLSPKDIL
jgi:hypothetical protein